MSISILQLSEKIQKYFQIFPSFKKGQGAAGRQRGLFFLDSEGHILNL